MPSSRFFLDLIDRLQQPWASYGVTIIVHLSIGAKEARAPGIGTRKLSAITPAERITPAGRFVSGRAYWLGERLMRLLPGCVSGLFLLIVGQTVAAQQVPTAGGQLQQIPPAVIEPRATPQFHVERAPPAAMPESGGPSFTVAQLHVTGASVLSESELINAAGFRSGSQMTLGDLRAIAARITTYYNARGYFLAQAYVPAQDVQGGSVTIAVVEVC